MTISAVHHVQITIPHGEEERARAFYCVLLGLEEVPKPESLRRRGGFWLQLGNAQVHVGCEGEVDRHQTKAHVAYQVSDLQALRERLRGAGVAITESVPIPGASRLEVRDPFGNRVEFIEPVS
ncbi:MAG: glyoxalase [Myxococcales bacterium]|nr:glyoxalase [Myxococcales bacterium]